MQRLRSFMSKFVVVYFDDILVYSQGVEDHLSYVCQVLRKHWLYINLKKCMFMTSPLLFLGFVISKSGVQIDEEKVKAIKIVADSC